MNIFNKHYVELNENKDIIDGFSDAFKEPHKNSICINSKGQRHFELLGAINPNLKNEFGYIYNYINDQIHVKTYVESLQTKEEIE